MAVLSVIPKHDVPRNPSTSFGVPYRRGPLKRDVAPTMNDPVNVIMTQSASWCSRRARRRHNDGQTRMELCSAQDTERLVVWDHKPFCPAPAQALQTTSG